MTIHPFSPFSRQNLGFKVKYFFFLIGDLCFLLAHSLKLYSSFSYNSFGPIVIERFFDIPKNMSTTLFPLSFHWKMVPFTYLFKSKILSLNGPWPPIFFDQFDSLSVKKKITKKTALLIETSKRPEPP